MRSAELCTEQDISDFVHDFYAEVRRDALLSPIFNAHVQDWDRHLAKLVDFWSSILRGTKRFKGMLMAKHVALPALNLELFKRWLALFDQVAARQPNQAMARHACDVAHGIAQSLWYGYRSGRRSTRVLTELSHD